MRSLTAFGIVFLLASAGQAQFGGYYGGGYGGGTYGGFGPGSGNFPGMFPGGGMANPGLYGGGLSPYLNLRNTNINNRAANYYNFVRPYTGGTYGNAIISAPSTMIAGRPPLFQNLSTIYGDDDDPKRQKLGEPDERGQIPVAMPPAGHPSGFMNTQGYFGLSNGMQGFGMGGGRAPAPRRR